MAAQALPPAERILFLCTANYYRSRFAEHYCRHLLAQRGLSLEVDSAGLEMQKWRDYNPGNLSAHTIQGLRELAIPLEAPYREPRQFEPSQWSPTTRLIALSQTEHVPMMTRLFPAMVERTEFWAVEDVEFAAPGEALPRICRSVEALIDSLGRGL
jgi:protein-tyrosine phosphatase